MENNGSFIIPKPCNEDWNKMSPEAQGRLCAVCSKCVVDFTQKSKEEMREIYVEKNGNVCGRVRRSQLAPNRKVKVTLPQRFSNAMSRTKIFAFALFAAFSMFFSSSSKGQNPNEIMKGQMVRYEGEGSLSGEVKWNNGEPAVGMKVQLNQNEGYYSETTTDAKGAYSFARLPFGDFTIVVDPNGDYYQSEKIKLNKNEKAHKNFKLEEEVYHLLGDIGYIEDDDPQITADVDTFIVPQIIVEPDTVEDEIIVGKMLRTVTPEDYTSIIIEDSTENDIVEPQSPPVEYINLQGNQRRIIEGHPTPGIIMGRFGKGASIHGEVEWDNGEPVSGMIVRIHKDEVFYSETQTDVKGRYSFSKLPEGEFTIVVDPEGEFYQSEKIQLDKGKNLKRDFKLEEMHILLGEMSFVDDIDPVVENHPIISEEDFIILDQPEAPLNSFDEIIDAEFSLRVYPNPTSGIISIQSENSELNVSVFDMHGKLLQQSDIKENMSIDLSAYPAGVYILKIVSEGILVERRVVKQ